MVTKSKLKLALAAEKGVDFKKLKEKRKLKAAHKEKQAQRGAASEDEDEEEEQSEIEEGDDDDEAAEEDDATSNQLNFDAVDESDTSDSSIELEEKIPRKPKQDSKKPSAAPAAEDAEDAEEEDEEDIPMSDLEDLDEADKEDLIPHTRLTINNTAALLTSFKRIALPTDKSVSFATHQTVVSSAETATSIPDVSDDLQRELAFYSQSLEAVRSARSKLKAEGVPFSRPKDYFAEMIKEDAHMEKVKAKLVEEASAKKASAEARKLRDLKKFGKQVQVAKLQERHKAKRETLEKIKTLKRKRQESGGDTNTTEADIFDVGVDNELAKHSRASASAGQGRNGSTGKRAKKNEKYGFGGKKRHAKSGDAFSSGDVTGFDAKRMKAKGGKAPRPGKSKRKAVR